MDGTVRIDELSRLLGNIETKVDLTQVTITTLQNAFYTDRDLQLNTNNRSASDRADIRTKIEELTAAVQMMAPIVRDYQVSRNKLAGALAVLVFLSGGAGAGISHVAQWIFNISK